MIDEVGISYTTRIRPSLQVASFTWGATNNQPVVFTEGGGIYNMTNFPFGSSENQRHTNQTILYKIMINMRVFTDSSQWSYCMKHNMYWWLIYDTQHADSTSNTNLMFEKLNVNCPNPHFLKKFLLVNKIMTRHISSRCRLTNIKSTYYFFTINL